MTIPARYLLRMAAFMAVVGFALFVIREQLLAAFAANPFLNGLIVAVLVVGIVFCLWLVIRLWPEVGWIRRSAWMPRFAMRFMITSVGASRKSTRSGRGTLPFPVPSGVVTARIDPRSGLLAYDGEEDAIDEVFLEGTAPTEQAPSPDTVSPDEFLMEQLGDDEPSAEANEITTEPLGEDT